MLKEVYLTLKLINWPKYSCNNMSFKNADFLKSKGIQKQQILYIQKEVIKKNRVVFDNVGKRYEKN
ncbi:MAG: hypothetical protein CV087_15085 [Candidatus Brocadia sp. WS118]|nr:MAG: hypothetical protein CV087_15085 [Candidatus Brocadia sp. WS118]